MLESPFKSSTKYTGISPLTGSALKQKLLDKIEKFDNNDEVNK